MNKAYRLNFCSVCKNRAFELKSGTICSITNNVPDFEISCPDYCTDKEALNDKIKGFNKYIKKNYPQNTFEKLLNNIRFKPGNGSNKSKLKNRVDTFGLVFKKDNFYDLMIAISSLVIYIMYVVFNFQKGFAVSFDSEVFNVSLIFLVFFFYSFYKAFYYNYEPEIIILEEGLLYKGLLIYWISILRYGVEIDKSNGKQLFTIIIYTIHNGVYKINTYNFKNRINDILQSIELNLKAQNRGLENF